MRTFLFFFLLLIITGCEKKIDFELNDVPPKLVVEATIENNEAPIVILTKSIGFFSQIDPAIFSGIFVHDAVVNISNGSLTHQLKEYSIPLPGGAAVYYYSIDSSNLATAFKGALNTSYSLSIVTDGNTYTAQTTIPLITRRIDSLYWKPTPFDTTGKKITLMVKATDPAGFGDYTRHWTKRNREPFLPGYNSVFDDLIIDGTTYEVPVDPGVDRTQGEPWDDENFSFFRGDTITLKLANINKATFEFWQSWEFSLSSVGNPFSVPGKVKGNISNGALGYFGGYASQYRSIIIPK